MLMCCVIQLRRHHMVNLAELVIMHGKNWSSELCCAVLCINAPNIKGVVPLHTVRI